MDQLVSQMALDQIKRIVESAAEQARWTLPNAFSAGGQMWNLSVGKEDLVCTRIRKLTIRTEYTLFPAAGNTPAFWSPTFGVKPKDSVPNTLEWTVPNDMPLWFGLKVTYGNLRQYKYEVNTPYLFIVNNGYMLLPLANHMSDSTLCAGDRMKDLHSSSLQELCGLALADFQTAPWNSDLPPDLVSTVALFRWSIDGKQLPPNPNRPWPAYCRRANNLAFDMFETEEVEVEEKEAEEEQIPTPQTAAEMIRAAARALADNVRAVHRGILTEATS